MGEGTQWTITKVQDSSGFILFSSLSYRLLSVGSLDETTERSNASPLSLFFSSNSNFFASSPSAVVVTAASMEVLVCCARLYVN